MALVVLLLAITRPKIEVRQSLQNSTFRFCYVVFYVTSFEKLVKVAIFDLPNDPYGPYGLLVRCWQ